MADVRENSRRSACSETSIAFLPYGLRFWGRQFETYASPGAAWDLPLDTPATLNPNTLGPMSEAVASVSAVALIWRQISEIRITKSFDKATPKILQQSVAGAFENHVDIKWTTTTKTKVDTFFHVELRDCGITGYEQSSGRDGGPPQENLTLNFDQIIFRTTLLNNKGQPEPAPVVGYDLMIMKTM